MCRLITITYGLWWIVKRMSVHFARSHHRFHTVFSLFLSFYVSFILLRVVFAQKSHVPRGLCICIIQNCVLLCDVVWRDVDLLTQTKDTRSSAYCSVVECCRRMLYTSSILSYANYSICIVYSYYTCKMRRCSEFFVGWLTTMHTARASSNASALKTHTHTQIQKHKYTHWQICETKPIERAIENGISVKLTIFHFWNTNKWKYIISVVLVSQQ